MISYQLKNHFYLQFRLLRSCLVFVSERFVDLLKTDIYLLFESGAQFALKNNRFTTLLRPIVSTMVSAWSWCRLLQERKHAIL